MERGYGVPVVLAVMILITLAEMGTTIYKTLRYGAAVRLG